MTRCEVSKVLKRMFLQSLSLGDGGEELEKNNNTGGSINRLESIEEMLAKLRKVVEGTKTEKTRQQLTEDKEQKKCTKRLEKQLKQITRRSERLKYMGRRGV